MKLIISTLLLCSLPTIAADVLLPLSTATSVSATDSVTVVVGGTLKTASIASVLALVPTNSNASESTGTNMDIPKVPHTVWIESDGNDSTAVAGWKHKPFLNISNAVAALTNGGTVHIGYGRFSPPPHLTNSVLFGWHLRGAQRPSLVPDYTGLTNGTIITGMIAVDADNVTLDDLGVDVGSVVTTNIYAGVPQSGIVFCNSWHTNESISGEGQGNGKPMREGCAARNVIVLCNDTASPVHNMLFENLLRFTGEDLVAIYGGIGIVVKAYQSHISRFVSQGHRLGNLYIKDNDYAPLNFVTISDGNIQAAEWQIDKGIVFQIHGGPSGTGNRVLTLNNIVMQGMATAVTFIDDGSSTWSGSLLFGDVYSANHAAAVSGSAPSTFHINP